MPPLAITQADLVAAVISERRDSGAATVRGLAKRLGRSVGATQNAIARAIDTGAIIRDDAAGSIRPSPVGMTAYSIKIDVIVDPESGRPIDVRLGV